MCCDRKLNMLNILTPILEYLSYLLPDFQTVFIIVMGIPQAAMSCGSEQSQLNNSISDCCDENRRRKYKQLIAPS